MDFGLMTEPQLGGTYDDLLAAARWAEEQGMAAFARSDHYYSSRRPAPDATDAYATLAGLARDTGEIRLCVLVSPITFRHPAVIAKTAATIDQMSGGRLDLGVGTGWNDAEHEAFGLPFPEWSERFERLGEALPYLRAAFHGDEFHGRFYSIEADARPRPSGMRLVVGGSGPRRTPTLAGMHADEYDHFLDDPAVIGPKVEVMRKAAEDAGRDPGEVLVSVMGQLFAGRDHAEYRDVIAREAAARDVSAEDFEQRLAERGVPHGTPERIGDVLRSLEEVGVRRLYLQWLDLADADGLTRTWEAVRSAT